MLSVKYKTFWSGESEWRECKVRIKIKTILNLPAEMWRHSEQSKID